jgi:type IV pilus assembly protein PilW
MDLTSRPAHPARRAGGASLLELMIGLAVGLFVVLGVATAYANATRSNRINDTVAVTQETARVLGQLVAHDVMAAGHWGLAPDAARIAGRAGAAGALATTAADDCADRWYIALDRALEAYEAANPFGASCIPDAAYRADTDVLALRYVGAAFDAATAPAGTAVLRAHRSAGALFLAGGAAPDLGAEAEDHPLITRGYWIGAQPGGEPAMHLGQLGVDGAAPGLIDSELAVGVEDFQVEFGVDMDDDEVVDGFRAADEIAPWDASRVRAVKFWLLVKDVNVAERAFDDKTYNYAGRSFTSTDGRYRYLYTTTVVRRNPG